MLRSLIGVLISLWDIFHNGYSNGPFHNSIRQHFWKFQAPLQNNILLLKLTLNIFTIPESAKNGIKKFRQFFSCIFQLLVTMDRRLFNTTFQLLLQSWKPIQAEASLWPEKVRLTCISVPISQFFSLVSKCLNWIFFFIIKMNNSSLHVSDIHNRIRHLPGFPSTI
jgi:hypothetical protein